MTYCVNFKKQAIKELAKINEPFYSNIKQAIYNLADNPHPQGYKKLKVWDGYKIRVGNYRIIYDIFDSELVVDIIALGHRKDIDEWLNPCDAGISCWTYPPVIHLFTDCKSYITEKADHRSALTNITFLRLHICGDGEYCRTSL